MSLTNFFKKKIKFNPGYSKKYGVMHYARKCIKFHAPHTNIATAKILYKILKLSTIYIAYYRFENLQIALKIFFFVNQCAKYEHGLKVSKNVRYFSIIGFR